MYGTALHTGAVKLKGPDGNADEARIKAFLLVGLAYFVCAVIVPVIMLVMRGASFKMTGGGFAWGTFAGMLGAVGALGVILAFGAKGNPTVVMSLIFAGAPLINAVFATILHPPDGGFGSIKWQFYAGVVLAACGGAMITYFKPPPPKPHAPPPAAAVGDATSPARAKS